MSIKKIVDPSVVQEFRIKLEDFNKLSVPFNPETYDVEHQFSYETDRVQGVILGATYWGYLYIELLWVEPEYRDQRIATQLLMEIEHEAITRGIYHAHLDTFSFQAREFYQKNGYRIAGTLHGFDGGVSRYTMYKNLSVQER